MATVNIPDDGVVSEPGTIEDASKTSRLPGQLTIQMSVRLIITHLCVSVTDLAL